MKFIADLHIHSKYSRATAKNLDLENLYYAAQVKGISLVGTGDFTHPAWIAELEEKLEQREPGLFALKPEFATALDARVPESCRGPVRFILQAEISNIYKKDGRVRKNHNLIYFPDLETAKTFNTRLDAIGNIKSDGRPILGLDARNLLEIMLETSDQGFFVPAHIWTPWFSMFGSKSGFDTMEECFGDLTPHIFACETGLSSDPPMNWRVKNLDRISLISNSDAHSPGFLGRNASVFDTDLDFFAIRAALETRDLKAFQGTLDMYPDQGKYHFDGHRKCGVRLNPDETARLKGLCPECGRPLTLGVLYRVRELADRPEGYRAENRHPFTYVVPLADILSEIFGVGPGSKKVTAAYDKAIETLGPELGILTQMDLSQTEKTGIPRLGLALDKMRKGDLFVEPGYDGEFGKVRLFTREEKDHLLGQRALGLTLSAKPEKPEPAPVKKKDQASVDQGIAGNKTAKTIRLRKKAAPGKETVAAPGLLDGLNPEQERAVRSEASAILIQAGPGTGKTRTLTARIAWLIKERQVAPQGLLALTFTNKAAGELAHRLESFLPKGGTPVLAATFHGFCLKMLKAQTGFDRVLMDDDLRREILGQALAVAEPGGKKPAQKLIRQTDHLISLAKQQFLGPRDDLSAVAPENPGTFARAYTAYESLCMERGTADFEDLIYLFYRALTRDAVLLDRMQERFSHIFVDEYQDLNQGQYRLVTLLAQKARLFVIGDPDQSIYGFRGSDNRFFNRFEADYPGCEKIRLTRNYRSTQTILDASFQMISGPEKAGDPERRIYSGLETHQKILIRETATASAEAVAVGKIIEGLMGGFSFLSMDKGSDHLEALSGIREYAFGDFAVLYRTRAQCEAFARAFEKAGIPFQTADREKWQNTEGIRDALVLMKLALGRPLPISRETGSPDPGAVAALAASGAQGMESPVLVERIGRLLNMEVRSGENQEIRSAWQHLVHLARQVPDPGALLDRLALDRDADVLAASAEKVSLMTLHAAKGLEFPVVFVTGCETGLIPFARDLMNVEDRDEERRLFYVAMTRAMDILCLTYAVKRRIYGLEKKQRRSCFIDDIERELARLDRQVRHPSPQKTETQLELF